MSFETIYYIIILVLLIISILLVKYLHKKNYRLKYVVPAVLISWGFISIILYPRVDYNIIHNPKIPIETKLEMIAKNKVKELGYDINGLKNTTYKKDNYWIVSFASKEEDLPKTEIEIKLNENLEIVDIER